MRYDIIIQNGKIIDGSGRAMFAGDIGISEGRINEIGDLRNTSAETKINARGKYVSPGFVDINNHSDAYWRIFSDPNLESLVYQGVTTIVGGNCGSSLAPLTKQDIITSIQKWADIKDINLNWLKFGEFLKQIEKRELAVNFGSLVGHGTLRRGLIHDEVRNLSIREMGIMEKMLKDALADGGLGLSTGLVYSHARIAPEKEIMKLAEIVAGAGGVYVTHLRQEGRTIIKSLEEAIRVAEKTKVKLQISHLKIVGEKNWPLMDEALSLLDRAWARGLDVAFDVFPYTATGTVLYAILPDWVTEGGKKMMINRLKDPNIRREVLNEMRDSDYDFSKITVAISSLDKLLGHRKISELAELSEKSPAEAIIDLLIASEGHVVTTMDVLGEDNLQKALTHPLAIISSNGSGYDLEHSKSGELLHPRNFGSFPRVLGHYVRERKLLSWEEAIHKMTAKPAIRYNLRERGLIKEGFHADIAIFDPKLIDGPATLDNPYQYAVGMSHVLVNGITVLEKGKINGQRPGSVFRKKGMLGLF